MWELLGGQAGQRVGRQKHAARVRTGLNIVGAVLGSAIPVTLVHVAPAMALFLPVRVGGGAAIPWPGVIRDTPTTGRQLLEQLTEMTA